jgi:hypothetical protein
MAAVQSKREERDETKGVDGEEDKSKGLFSYTHDHRRGMT